MKIADETAASLQKAVISTENTVKAVDKITEATAEQSQAVSQVTQGWIRYPAWSRLILQQRKKARPPVRNCQGRQ